MKKYYIYLFFSLLMLGVWIWLAPILYPANKLIIVIFYTLLIFLIIVLSMILIPQFHTVDLSIKDYRKITWVRVFIVIGIALTVGYSLVYGISSFQSIKSILNTAVFGMIAGYGITRFEEARKHREEWRQFLNALLLEVGQNRFNCQAIINGHPPVFFQTYVWDNLRLNKHFLGFGSNQQLTNNLFNLYLSIMAANWRVNILNVATNNFIINHGQVSAQGVVNNAQQLLNDFLQSNLLQQLQNMERELGDFRSSIN